MGVTSVERAAGPRSPSEPPGEQSSEPRPAAATAAWIVAGLCLLFSAAGLVLQVITRDVPVPIDFGSRQATLVLGFVFLTVPVVGAMVVRRQPSSPIGWIFLATGALMAVYLVLDGYAIYVLRYRAGSFPLGRHAAWLANWNWVAGWGLVALMFLLFPDGRLPSPRWRPLVWAIVVVSVAGSIVLALAKGRMANYVWLPNPYGVIDLGSNGGVTAKFAAALALLPLGAASLVSLFSRLRRAEGDERQQLKWLGLAGGIVVVGLAALAILVASGVRLSVGEKAAPAVAVVIPLAIGLALLKYRLYDIDVVISKTFVFGALAAFVTAVYIAIVVGIGNLVGSGGEPNVGLSIAATAIVAVAFQPMRTRVQHWANRLVYGERATPYEVLTEFSEQMAGNYLVEDILPRMAQILAEGVGAAGAEVWLRVGPELRPVAGWPESEARRPLTPIPIEGHELPDIPGFVYAFPVRRQHELLGAVTVRMAGGEPLSGNQRRVLIDIANQASLVLRNVQLIAELQASRQRIVAAQDQERRRLERNIHDGAQQQLVALAVRLRLAANLASKESPSVTRLLEQLQAEASDAMENLRDLARGIYPPLLADKGLVAALTTQARKATVPVEVEAEDVGRFPQETEAAVYFVTLEALQNVAKYAGATHARVRLWTEPDELWFRVEDDGAGFDPATAKRGSGLQNMADRLSALGGTLAVESGVGRGTTVTGRLPVRRP